MKIKKTLLIVLMSLTTINLVSCKANFKNNNNNEIKKVSQSVEKKKPFENQKKNTSLKNEKHNSENKTNKSTNKIENNKTKEKQQKNKQVDNFKKQKGVEILQRGYIGGGVNIVFTKTTTINGYYLYEYNIESIDKKDNQIVYCKKYVDVENEKVYSFSENGKFEEELLK